MKRIANIITVLFLSVMILIAGAGLTIIHCEHEGYVSVAQVSAEAQQHKCCTPMKKCMTVTVHKLQPTVTVHYAIPDFHVLQPLLYTVAFVEPQVESLPVKQLAYSGVIPHGPPRSYLNTLCVLLI